MEINENVKRLGIVYLKLFEKFHNGEFEGLVFIWGKIPSRSIKSRIQFSPFILRNGRASKALHVPALKLTNEVYNFLNSLSIPLLDNLPNFHRSVDWTVEFVLVILILRD